MRRDLARLEARGDGDGRQAASIRRLEAVIREGLGHTRLFSNASGLPLRRNLDREFRMDLARAGIDRTGLCIHSLRYTANSAMLAAGVNKTVIRARMGHVSAKMTERTHDPSYDDGAGTRAMAALIGVTDDVATGGDPPAGSPPQPQPDLAEEEVLRPPRCHGGARREVLERRDRSGPEGVGGDGAEAAPAIRHRSDPEDPEPPRRLGGGDAPGRPPIRIGPEGEAGTWRGRP